FYDNNEAIEGLGGLTRPRVHIKDGGPRHHDWAFMHVTLGGRNRGEVEMPLVVGIERFVVAHSFNFITSEAGGPTKIADNDALGSRERPATLRMWSINKIAAAVTMP
ncbi:hypothetical protein FOZ62_017976, partial [Perkinsus olseni]